jgi:dCMP deaminase
LAKDLRILEKENLSELDSYSEIIFSDDEVGKELAEKYFKNKKVIFDQTFLRWGSMKAVSKDVPDADQTISSYDLDKEFIQTAKDNSKKSPDWWRQVGALVVREGKIILSGYNKHLPSENSAYIDGDPRSNFNAGERIDLSLALHGEAGLIAEAARKGISLEGSSIYVTTFPCPNCAGMIVNAGIKKVYYSEGYSLLNAQENFKQAGVSLIKVI